MKSISHKKSCFYPNHLLIEHIIDFKYHSDIPSCKKHIKDENEQKLFEFISDIEKFKVKPFYNENEVYDFLSSKLKAMEKMHLDDECCLEGKIETRKINIDKKFFPKPKIPKNRKFSFSPKKLKINIKKQSKKKWISKSNSKNIIIKVSGKVEKPSMKSIDLEDFINIDNNKEIKIGELYQFFSNKKLLTSILDEMEKK